MDQWEFIEKAAAELGIGPEAIRKWRDRSRGGVPSRYRLDILDIAARENYALDRASFDNPPGPRRQMAAA